MDGLIGRYLFKGDANGVVHGATLTADRFGNANRAYHFDGVDDYIEIAPPPAINASAFSVSVWLKAEPRDTNGWTNCIIAQDDGNDDDQARRVFQISMFYNRIVWHRMVGARDPMCRRPVRSGTWLHVVGMQENGEHRIYLDGELQDSVKHAFWTHTDQPIHIGRKGTNEPYFFFKGDLDDVRLFNHALNADEVRALCHEGGWQPVSVPISTSSDPISGKWGQHGAVLFDIRYDGRNTITGRIMARDPGHMAPISRGKFDPATGALSLAGTASHPDNGSPVPYLIEGHLADDEITVVAQFHLSETDHYCGNHILTRPGARGGWWLNSPLRWRLRKLLGKRA